MNFSQKNLINFWKKVDIKGEDECWNWTASLKGDGYGQFKLNGTMKGAHCCSLFLAHAVQPLNKPLTLHLCAGNRKCVNPNHLYYGDQPDNERDKVKDGTILKGESQWNSKLTEQQVREIRKKYIPREYTQKKLAEEYEISRSVIYRIINYKNWKHVN